MTVKAGDALQAIADGLSSLEVHEEKTTESKVFESASLDLEPLTEYSQLFAMESIRLWKGLSSIRMKVCHEHVKIRRHEWRLIMEQVLAGDYLGEPDKERYEAMISRWADTKKEKYGKLITWWDESQEFWVVYAAELGPNNYDPLDLSKIMALFFIHPQPSGNATFLHLPMVSLKKEGLPSGLEGLMEGFSVRMSTVNRCIAKDHLISKWTRRIPWADHLSQPKHRSLEFENFKSELWKPLGESHFELDEEESRFVITKEYAEKVEEEFHVKCEFEFDKIIEKPEEIRNFPQVAWLMQATRVGLNFVLQDLIEIERVFEVLRYIDFRENLRNSGFPSVALKSYHASDQSSFNLVDFTSNCFLLARFGRLEDMNESAYAENEWFWQFYLVGEPEVPALVKHINVRKLVFSPDSRSADKILDLTLDDLPASLRDFYCSINTIAFASVRYKRLDLLKFAARLILQKFLTISPRPSDPLVWFVGESGRALFQASALTTHLLMALSCSAIDADDLNIEVLDEAISAQSLEKLHQQWCNNNPRAAVGLLTDCSQFYNQ